MALARLNPSTHSPTGLLSLDWSAPWLRDWQATAGPVLSALLEGAPLHDALNAQLSPVRFVAQSDLPSGVAYEAFIAQTRCVPTRDNLHDALNALAWLRFPQTKTLLNRLQMQEIRLRGVGSTRGPLRDAVTVFDENGGLLIGTNAIQVTQALRERRWLDALHHNRADWQAGELRLVLFGHALIEKLAQPRLPMVAHLLNMSAPISFTTAPQGDGDLDAALARSLSRTFEALLSATPASAKPFSPLPVLGIPGWHQGNADTAFYANANVFRSGSGFSSENDHTPARPQPAPQSSG